MKKVNVIIELSKEGFYSVYVDDDSLDYGVNGQGCSVLEAKASFLTTLNDIKELYLEEGRSFEDVEFVYKYDLASFLDYYSKILSKSGLERITGINQKQLWHYSAGIRTPKKDTVLKIQEGLHKFAKELSQVEFID